MLIFTSVGLSGYATAQTLIVALGDSLTEGYGVSKEEAYPYLVEQELIRKGYTVRIINAGIVSQSVITSLDVKIKITDATNNLSAIGSKNVPKFVISFLILAK